MYHLLGCVPSLNHMAEFFEWGSFWRDLGQREPKFPSLSRLTSGGQHVARTFKVQQLPPIAVSNFLQKRWSLGAFTGAVAQMKQEECHLCEASMNDVPWS